LCTEWNSINVDLGSRLLDLDLDFSISSIRQACTNNHILQGDMRDSNRSNLRGTNTPPLFFSSFNILIGIPNPAYGSCATQSTPLLDMATRIDHNDGTITNKLPTMLLSPCLSYLSLFARHDGQSEGRWKWRMATNFNLVSLRRQDMPNNGLEAHADKLRTKSPKAKVASQTTDEEAQRMEMILRRLE